MIKTGKINLAIGLLFFLQAVALLGQDIQVKASVSDNPVSVDEQFSYSVEVSGKSTSLPDPQVAGLSDFFVLSGPNSSTNIQWINGRMSASKTYTYYLQPKRTGTFQISPATVQYHGKTYQSNAIRLQVTKTKSGRTAKSSARSGSTPAITDKDNSGKSLFIKTAVSKRKVYVGEQILVTYKLYFRGNVRTYNIDKYPSNAGFWTEEFDMPRQPVISSAIVNGINYNVAVLRKIALFPTRTGTLFLEPLEVTLEEVVAQRRSRRSLFDSFFDDPFGRTVRIKVVTKKIKIKVLPVPEANKPADFAGAVGHFRLSAKVDKHSLSTNQAVSLKLRISGTGNIKMVAMPNVTIPPDIEKYDPKISFKPTKKNNQIGGIKTAEIILVPRLAGTYTIKPIRFSYFDPQKKQYQTLQTNPITLQVAQGKNGPLISGTQNSGLSQQEVQLLGKDIRYIKEYTEFEPIGYKAYLTLSFWLTILGLVLLFAGFVLWDDYRLKLMSDAELARKTRAGKVASKQLTVARSHLSDEASAAFYKALSAALQGFVRDKLNIELTEFSAANIKKVLGERGIPEEDIREYQAVLEESDFSQFSGTQSGRSERDKLFERAKAILTRLEKWI